MRNGPLEMQLMEEPRNLRERMRSAKRASVYPFVGAALAFLCPGGLLLAEALWLRRFPGSAFIMEQLLDAPLTYAYLLGSALLALSSGGLLLGRMVDRLMLLSNTDPLT